VESKIENPEKLATWGTEDEGGQTKQKQTQIT
jgi:hypothetical protein